MENSEQEELLNRNEFVKEGFGYIAGRIRRAKDTEIIKLRTKLNKILTDNSDILAFYVFDLLSTLVEEEMIARGLRKRYKFPRKEVLDTDFHNSDETE